jgi:CDP-diacylglycerol--glycerol-3-phosphate 3-phosphatidyltransferase
MYVSRPVQAVLKRFVVPAASIQPLPTPTAFYQQLLQLATDATRKISLASLYVGNGALEQELIGRIRRNSIANPELSVVVQLDYARGLRSTATKSLAKDDAILPLGHSNAPSSPSRSLQPYDSSAHMMLELLQPVNGSPRPAHVGFTLMPQHRGFIGQLLPQRFNEGIGVFHMKAYVFDDNLLLSGANLSNDYFTNRQDRYVLFRDVPDLASYAHNLVLGIQNVPGSHKLRADGQIIMNPTDPYAPAPTNVAFAPAGSGATNTPSATGSNAPLLLNAAALPKIKPAPLPTPMDSYIFGKKLLSVLSKASNKSKAPELTTDLEPPGSAVVVPRLQMGPLGLTDDEEATEALLEQMPPATAVSAVRGVLHMATGYFNMTPRYEGALVRSRPDTSAHIVTAGPKANGFHGGHSISGGIPVAYSEMVREFVETVARYKRQHVDPIIDPFSPGITVYEYEKPGHTFHGKGGWLSIFKRSSSVPSLKQPDTMLTLIGSPNFGRRSVERDLEMQLYVSTSDPALIQRLAEERDALFDTHSQGAHIKPVVRRVAELDVWSQPERQISGTSYEKGWWIHVARRVLRPYL